MPPTVCYLASKRYTLQWLINPDSPRDLVIIPDNMDAAFRVSSREPKPSDLLLHYNYGSAAVKQWGHGVDYLKSLAPRPTPPVPAPMGPSKIVHDRTIAVGKRKPPPTRGVRARKATARAGAGEMVESEGKASWDEDDVMLFFWGNTPAAKERHRKKVQETTQQMEAWRESVPQG
jgi:hypothetical protein